MNDDFDSSEKQREAIDPTSSLEVSERVKGLVIFENHSKATVPCEEIWKKKSII